MIRVFPRTTKKFGTVKILIDSDDAYLLENYSWTLYSTPRHHTTYVVFSNCKNSRYRHKKLARIILDAPKTLLVDHINGNGLDNRRENLRLVSPQQNNCNARKRKSAKTSQYKGVHFDRGSGQWVAQLQFKRKKIFIKKFSDEKEAAKAYNECALANFRQYAKLNRV